MNEPGFEVVPWILSIVGSAFFFMTAIAVVYLRGAA